VTSLFGGLFSGRRVLVTGHTGFKGSWLCDWLLELGAEVYGYALDPETTPSLFDDLGLVEHIDSVVADIRDLGAVNSTMQRVRPEIVIHMAAQPLVLRSYAEPVYTFDTNVMGTANLLSAVRECDETRVVVNVTTDKVYLNREQGRPFAEDDPLGGHDPYSASKACAEIVTASMRDSYFASGPLVASARAGNVIGGGDWAENRIVPDIVRALSARRPVEVRNPSAIRPWQHVLEPLGAYLHLASRLWSEDRQFAEAWNFGPDQAAVHTVQDVVERAIEVWGEGSWQGSGTALHEAGVLTLDIAKAAERLGWRPVWGFDRTVERTVEWYRGYAEDASNAPTSTAADIAEYVRDARANGAPWA